MSELDEILDVVDDDGNIIDTQLRSVVWEKKLKTRYIQVFVFNDRGEILIQQRAATRHKYPNLIDPSVGGHVASGESYEEAAMREMEEELGINEPLKLVRHINEFFGVCALYTLTHNGPFTHNERETAKLDFVTLDEMAYLIKRFPYIIMDGFMTTFPAYLEHIGGKK